MENNNLFWYFVIFVIIVYYFSSINIGINVMFGIGVGLLVISLLHVNHQQKEIEKKSIQEEKLNLIQPRPTNSTDEIVNYLFSIQDFYNYNPMAYEDMVESIDHFFDRYNETLKDNSLTGVNYELMFSEKKNIMNSLFSIIYKLPSNKQYDGKLKKSIEVISNILQQYLNKMEYINNKFIYDNGIINTTKFIQKKNIQVQPINLYDNEISIYNMI